MKTQFIATVVLISVFVLFVILTTLFTLLDAFVFDRPVEGGTIVRNPMDTILPTNTRPPKDEVTTPSIGDNSTNTNPSGGSNSSEGDGKVTVGTDAGSSAPTPTTDTPESTKNPVTQDTPVTSEAPVTTETPNTTEVPGTTETPNTTEAPPVLDYPIIEKRYYKDENIEIKIDEKFYLNQNGVYTRYFAVDIKLSDIEYLRTHFNTDRKGNIVKDTTSNLASDVDAIFAINGDYFSFRKVGFVLRNYELIRASARDKADDDALLIMDDGSFIMIDEHVIGNASVLPLSVYQCFTFGPRLIEYGEIAVDEESEVGQHAESNPRTAIGIVEPLHYKIVVSEGRLEEGELKGKDGLTLLELAELMQELGCDSAYNLDGGSSTTLYFNGEVLNTPGRDDGSERKISDIIYINGISHSDEN